MTASKHEKTKGPVNHIAEAIALLDEIDGMAFGKVDAALNALSGKLSLARSEHDALVEALESLLFASERHIFGDECKSERAAARSALSLAKTEG